MRKQYHSKYYEATIQLRPDNPDVFEFIKRDVNKRNDVFISSMEKKKYGLDIKISSQRYARALARKLQKQFDGDVKLTYTLYTEDRQTSKKLHRATLLYRAKKNEQQTI